MPETTLACVPAAASPVQEATAEMDRNILQLENLLDQLVDRLTAVRMETPAETKDAPVLTASLAALPAYLFGHASRLERLNGRMRSLLNGMQL